MKNDSSFSAHRIEGGYWWLHIRSNWIQSELSAHAWRHEARGKFMKRPKKKAPEPEMRAECDFSKGVRGKYVKRLSEGSNLILLDPDCVFRKPLYVFPADTLAEI